MTEPVEPVTEITATPLEQSEATTAKAADATTEAEIKTDAGTRPYDVDYPETFKAFMRNGWGDSSLAVSRRPEADYFCSPHPIGNTGMRVYLKRGVHGKDRRGKSSRHRLIVICTCGQHVPAGRMGQHRHSHRHYAQEASK